MFSGAAVTEQPSTATVPPLHSDRFPDHSSCQRATFLVEEAPGSYANEINQCPNAAAAKRKRLQDRRSFLSDVESVCAYSAQEQAEQQGRDLSLVPSVSFISPLRNPTKVPGRFAREPTVLLPKEGLFGLMARPGRSLMRVDWVGWFEMAEASLTAAAELIWQANHETASVIELWTKVTGRPIPLATWKNHKTWRGATFLSLAAEQSMKCLLTSKNLTFKWNHNLNDLWRRLDPSDRNKVADEVRTIGQRVSGTRLSITQLDSLPTNDVERLRFMADTLYHHRSLHTDSRYYKESYRDFDRNIELWRAALALYAALPRPADMVAAFLRLASAPVATAQVAY